MSAAEGADVVSIKGKDGQPVRRSWRVAVSLYGPPCVLGVAILRAETPNDAARIVRDAYAPCVVFGVSEA